MIIFGEPAEEIWCAVCYDPRDASNVFASRMGPDRRALRKWAVDSGFECFELYRTSELAAPTTGSIDDVYLINLDFRLPCLPVKSESWSSREWFAGLAKEGVVTVGQLRALGDKNIADRLGWARLESSKEFVDALWVSLEEEAGWLRRRGAA